MLVHWLLKCWCLLLPFLLWPLSICLDSWTWHSRFLCNIVLYSIGLYLHHQTHPQLSVISALTQPFYSSGAIDPLFPSSILDTFDLGDSSSGAYLFPFSYHPWGSPGKNTGGCCHFFLQCIMFCKNSSVWLLCLGWSYTARLIGSLSYASPFTMTRLWSQNALLSSLCIPYSPDPDPHSIVHNAARVLHLKDSP